MQTREEKGRSRALRQCVTECVLGKSGGTPPWSEITRNTFMRDAEELCSSTREGLNGQRVLNQQITFI